MELTFEYEKDLFAGSYPAVVVRADETLGYVYQSGNAFMGRTIVVDTANANNSVIGEPTVIATDVSPNTIEVRHIGPQNWLMWNSGTKQRIAMVPEAPKIMNKAFYDGFITGNILRNGNLSMKSKNLPAYSTDLPDEDRISYNNGLLLGQLGTL